MISSRGPDGIEPHRLGENTVGIDFCEISFIVCSNNWWVQIATYLCSEVKDICNMEGILIVTLGPSNKK